MSERITGRDVCDVCRSEIEAGAACRHGRLSLERMFPAPPTLADVPPDALAWGAWIAGGGAGVPPCVLGRTRAAWDCMAYPDVVLFRRLADGETIRASFVELQASWVPRG